jgi:hypothetical protein
MAIEFKAFPGNIFWRAKAREVLNNLVVIRMFDRHLMLIGDAVVPNDPSELPWNLLEAKQISIFDSEKSPSQVVSGLISDNLWTCKCDHNFIRSKLLTRCIRCGTTLEKQTERLIPLNTVLQWSDFVIDASTYELDPDDADY